MYWCRGQDEAKLYPSKTNVEKHSAQDIETKNIIDLIPMCVIFCEPEHLDKIDQHS